MFDIENVAVIVGDSPFIEEIQDKLSYLLNRYFSLGINNIIKKYETNIHLFQDIPFCSLTNKYPQMKTVAPYVHGDLITKDNKELIDSYSFDFKKDKAQDIYKDGKLAWCGFTHDYAVSYCIMKGYKNIILIGAADFIRGKHFMTEDVFSPSDILAEKSKRFIEEICTQRINIYTCNPESTLKVPRISLDELLK